MCSREVNCGGGEVKESKCSLGLLAVLLHTFQMLQGPWTPPTGLQVVAGFQDSPPSPVFSLGFQGSCSFANQSF